MRSCTQEAVTEVVQPVALAAATQILAPMSVTRASTKANRHPAPAALFL